MANKYDPDRPKFTPPIERAEAVALCRSGKLDNLAERHLWLVSMHASDLAKEWNVDYQGCYTEGCVGLMQGVKALKRDSTNPTAYLWSRVWGTIQDYCEKEVKERKERRAAQFAKDSRGRYGRQGKRLVSRFSEDKTLDKIIGLCNDTQTLMVYMLVEGHGIQAISKQLGIPPSTLYASLKSLESRYDLLYHRRVEKHQSFESLFRKSG